MGTRFAQTLHSQYNLGPAVVLIRTGGFVILAGRQIGCSTNNPRFWLSYVFPEHRKMLGRIHGWYGNLLLLDMNRVRLC